MLKEFDYLVVEEIIASVVFELFLGAVEQRVDCILEEIIDRHLLFLLVFAGIENRPGL